MPTWTQKTPGESGWYWVKYKNKHDSTVICPAWLTVYARGTHIVDTAKGDIFVEGPDYGGRGMRRHSHGREHGQPDASFRFGAKLDAPGP